MRYARMGSKPRLTPLDRAFWVAPCPGPGPVGKMPWVIVKPDTVIRWHRKGFRLYWRGPWAIELAINSVMLKGFVT